MLFHIILTKSNQPRPFSTDHLPKSQEIILTKLLLCLNADLALQIIRKLICCKGERGTWIFTFRFPNKLMWHMLLLDGFVLGHRSWKHASHKLGVDLGQATQDFRHLVWVSSDWIRFKFRTRSEQIGPGSADDVTTLTAIFSDIAVPPGTSNWSLL